MRHDAFELATVCILRLTLWLTLIDHGNGNVTCFFDGICVTMNAWSRVIDHFDVDGPN